MLSSYGNPPADSVQEIATQLADIHARLEELPFTVRAAGYIQWRSPAADTFRAALDEREGSVRVAAAAVQQSGAELAQFAAQLSFQVGVPTIGPGGAW